MSSDTQNEEYAGPKVELGLPNAFVPDEDDFKRAIDIETPDPDEYLKKAKQLARIAFNAEFTPGENTPLAVDSDFYIVWFSKVLGNWKALVSTDLISSQYWELTHNGAKEETYIDHYIKQKNWAVKDSDHEPDLS